jgi:hypothetical protein
VSKDELRKAKKRLESEISASIKKIAATPSQLSTPPPNHAPVHRRSGLVLMLEIFGVIAAIATIVGGTGYAFEKWQDTKATIDFSGEIDQKKPFTVPLVVKNPSSLFTVHFPRILCSLTVNYGGGSNPNFFMATTQPPSPGAPIAPGGTENYFCDAPDKMAFSATPGGPPIPIQEAEMFVLFEYETWVPWPVSRRVPTEFVMLKTADKFRWIKGAWAGRKELDWPPNIPHP